MVEKVKLPPFRIRKGEDEEQARKRWIESLTVEQMKELVRQKAPAAKKYLDRKFAAERKRQKAS